MPQIPAPRTQTAIVTDTGKMHDQFRRWTVAVSRLGVLIGTGSPEGVQEAQQTVLYMDDAGTTGAIFYIKRDADIAGDKTKGWILI